MKVLIGFVVITIIAIVILQDAFWPLLVALPLGVGYGRFRLDRRDEARRKAKRASRDGASGSA